jgi:hypothetical protein
MSLRMRHLAKNMLLPIVGVALATLIARQFRPLTHKRPPSSFGELIHRGLFEKADPLSAMVLIGIIISIVFLVVLAGIVALRIAKAPHKRRFTIIQLLYSPVDVERVFKPLIADWRQEYFDALVREGLWRARLVNLQYYFRFGQAMGLNKAWTLFDLMVRAIKAAIRIS